MTWIGDSGSLADKGEHRGEAEASLGPRWSLDAHLAVRIISHCSAMLSWQSHGNPMLRKLEAILGRTDEQSLKNASTRVAWLRSPAHWLKRKSNFPHTRKFWMEQLQSHIWLTASSYMDKYLRISSFIRKPFLIYDFATVPFWISLYMRKIWFPFFISAGQPCWWPPDDIASEGRAALAGE